MLQTAHLSSFVPLTTAALLLAGCANTGATRDLAGQTSIRLTADSSLLGRFVGTAQQSAQDRTATLAVMQLDKAQAQTAVEMQKSAWTMAGRKDLLDLTGQLQRVQPADILATMPTAAPPAPALDDGGAGAALDEAAATYATMAKKPDFKHRVKEVFVTGQAVEEAVRAIQDKAATTATPAAGTGA